MRAYELIKETFLRNARIRLVHIGLLATYGLVFLIPVPDVWSWGILLFIASGCLLPLVLSAGIFGDDIASGRISFLIIKPLWLGELYVYRFVGLSLQALLHVMIAGCIILALHSVTGRGSTDNFALWMLSSWLIFNAWAALSTSLSVVTRRTNNSMLLFFAIVMAYFTLNFLMMFFPKHAGTAALLGTLRYTCPPVELLGKLASSKYSLVGSLGCVMHSLLLTTLYGVAGIIILSKRQFKCKRD